MDTDITFFLLAGCGIVLLRPADVPVFARYAGRIVGFTVRTARGLQSATETAITQGEQMLNSQGGNVGAVREDLQASLSKLDSLRSTVSRDMAGVKAFTPVEMIRSRIRAKQASAVKGSPRSENTRESGSMSTDVRKMHGGKVQKTRATRSLTPSGEVKTGADFIARSIEEAALARQKERIFGRQTNEVHASSEPHGKPGEDR